jgi:hypothetical protein
MCNFDQRWSSSRLPSGVSRSAINTNRSSSEQNAQVLTGSGGSPQHLRVQNPRLYPPNKHQIANRRHINAGGH